MHNDVQMLQKLIVELDDPTKISQSIYTMYAFFSNSRPPSVEKSNLILKLDQCTLLHVAAYYDSLECFIFLQGLGLDAEGPNAYSYLPIHYACSNGSIEVATLILFLHPKQASAIYTVEVIFIFIFNYFF